MTLTTSWQQRAAVPLLLCMSTRLTNAFSKKIENHVANIALHIMHYNFCRIHQTLRVTPAMEAGIANRLWSIEDVIGLLE